MRERLLKMVGAKPAPGDLLLVQAFINSAELDTDRDDFATPESLRAWFSALDLIGPKTPVTEADRKHAIEVREALRNLTLANNGAVADPNALQTLNRAMRSAQMGVRFEADGKARLEPHAPGVDGALGRILAIAFDSMADGSWRRLKACPADRCFWAFYDETKNRSGTWCTMKVCGNRTKARVYRRRHAAASAAS